MDQIWSAFNFEHEVHNRTGTKLLKSDEELVETLEDNQVQLQTLMTSKYIVAYANKNVLLTFSSRIRTKQMT